MFLFQNGNLPFNKFEFLVIINLFWKGLQNIMLQVMWMFREVGAPYLFLHALLNPAIRWRTLEFKLKWGGKAEAIPARTNSNIIIKDPATIKFSKPEELCALPLHVIN